MPDEFESGSWYAFFLPTTVGGYNALPSAFGSLKVMQEAEPQQHHG